PVSALGVQRARQHRLARQHERMAGLRLKRCACTKGIHVELGEKPALRAKRLDAILRGPRDGGDQRLAHTARQWQRAPTDGPRDDRHRCAIAQGNGGLRPPRENDCMLAQPSLPGARGSAVTSMESEHPMRGTAAKYVSLAILMPWRVGWS